MVLIMLFGSFGGMASLGPEMPLKDQVEEGPSLDGLMGNRFTLNKGQISDDDVIFHSQNVYFTTEGIIVRVIGDMGFDGPETISGEGQRPFIDMHVFKVWFEGAGPVVPTGRGEISSSTNYFYGNDPSRWATNVPSYNEIVYEGLYDNIDLVYMVVPQGIKYEFIVHPGGDLDDIRSRYEGGTPVTDGEDLFIRTSVGTLMDTGLFVYQDEGVPLEARMVVTKDTVTYDVEYDRTRTLVIDPILFNPEWNEKILTYSTFINGSFGDISKSIELDSSGLALIAGETMSDNFPTTPGAYDRTYDWVDSFVLKMNHNGSNLTFSTYIGGTHLDHIYSMTIDPNDDIYLTGKTYSTDFPTTSGVYDETHNDGNDIFVTKMKSTGDALLFSTYIGGSGNDMASGLDLDGSNNIYLTGETWSKDFPNTTGAFRNNMSGFIDLFVLKLKSDGSDLAYSSFLGGNMTEYKPAITVDSSGSAYVTGETYSSDFPNTTGAYDTTFNGSRDAFITKFLPNGSGLDYSTFLGGDNLDIGSTLIVDPSGSVYVSGYTFSTDFPITNDAYDPVMGGVYDMYVTKINPSGTDVTYSTFMGGDGGDFPGSLVLLPSGDLMIAGHTSSGNFPVTPGSLDETPNGASDAFISILNFTTANLSFSTYLGGLDPDKAHGVAYDPAGYIYVTGETWSINFPSFRGNWCHFYTGGIDGFITKIRIPTVPYAPLNLTALLGDERVELTWEEGDDGGNNITAYRLLRGTAIDDLGNIDVIGNQTLFNDTNVTNGVNYFYAVEAFNILGWGERSDVISITPGAIPTEPLDLTAAVGDRFVQLNWSVPLDDKGYDLIGYNLYKAVGDTNLSLYQTVDVLGFNDTLVENGVTYNYTVTAVNALGEGLMSAMVRATPRHVPSEPINVTAKGFDNRVTVQWEEPGTDNGFPVLHYLVYKGSSPDTLELFKESPATSFLDTEVENGVDHHYSVSAVNEVGEGPMSEVTMARPGRIPMAPDLNATPGDGHVLLNWSLMDDGGYEVLHYSLYRGEDPVMLELLHNVTGSQYNDTDVENDVRYHYKVSATNLLGEGPMSAVKEAVPFKVLINNNPVIDSRPVLEATVGKEYTYQVVASDPDGDNLTYNLTEGPEGMTVDAQGLITWTPDKAGDHDMVLTVLDIHLASVSQNWRVKVREQEVAIVVTIVSPKEGEEVRGNMTITGMTSINYGNITQVRVKVDDGDWVVVKGLYAWHITFDLTDLKEGNHTISAEATDNIHVSNTSITIVVKGPEQNGGNGGGGDDDDGLGNMLILWGVLVIVICVVMILAIRYKIRKGPATTPPPPEEPQYQPQPDGPSEGNGTQGLSQQENL